MVFAGGKGGRVKKSGMRGGFMGCLDFESKNGWEMVSQEGEWQV